MHTTNIDITLTSMGRQLTFSKEFLEVAHVFRRAGGEGAPWQRVAVNTRSPFLDTDVFAPSTLLAYYVHYETQQGEPADRSHVVSTTLP
ncbi:hypothetical protein [Hymenobacter sp. BT559]|jgi:hypothetical protein|uniref:hypothetical protein n=1 Tax=Hymenobacter sp. BT559 TaxID=2795729 RepID=UPI0012249B3F|nr:hypothetical protein [Hymenobacter sp. BT559]MBJ6146030.1 hypothetical protein [Hymenobacter sp. BT559]RZK31643.1 MAG: hypothetical protein EOO63_03625 [Hymenobacter sp.]